MSAINKLRRRILDMPPAQAIETLLKLLEQFPTNEDLLKSLARPRSVAGHRSATAGPGNRAR